MEKAVQTGAIAANALLGAIQYFADFGYGTFSRHGQRGVEGNVG